jgi:hypothetical protein
MRAGKRRFRMEKCSSFRPSRYIAQRLLPGSARYRQLRTEGRRQRSLLSDQSHFGGRALRRLYAMRRRETVPSANQPGIAMQVSILIGLLGRTASMRLTAARNKNKLDQFFRLTAGSSISGSNHRCVFDKGISGNGRPMRHGRSRLLHHSKKLIYDRERDVRACAGAYR